MKRLILLLMFSNIAHASYKLEPKYEPHKKSLETKTYQCTVMFPETLIGYTGWCKETKGSTKYEFTFCWGEKYATVKNNTLAVRKEYEDVCKNVTKSS